MSLLILSIVAAIGVTIQENITEAIERYRERAKWARRRPRRYTFN